MRRLVISNCKAARLDTFKDVLSNPATAPFEPDKTPTSLSNQLLDDNLASSPAPKTFGINSLIAAKLKSSEKQKAKGKSLSRHPNKRLGKNALRLSTPLPVAMELIRLSKQRVKIPANAVENTLSKYMHQLSIS